MIRSWAVVKLERRLSAALTRAELAERMVSFWQTAEAGAKKWCDELVRERDALRAQLQAWEVPPGLAMTSGTSVVPAPSAGSGDALTTGNVCDACGVRCHVGVCVCPKCGEELAVAREALSTIAICDEHSSDSDDCPRAWNEYTAHQALAALGRED